MNETELEITNLIQRFVDDHWKENKSACYLSSIGNYLRFNNTEYRSIFPKGLGNFIQKYRVVQIVQFPNVEQKIAAIPLGIELPEDITKLFSQNKKSSYSKNIYIPEFWRAFIEPITNSTRHVAIDCNNRVSIHEDLYFNFSEEEISEKIYEITHEDLTNSVYGQPISEKINATHLAVSVWLKKNYLMPDIFLMPAHKSRRSICNTQLNKFINAFRDIPYEDLSRIQIPLDILIKLGSVKWK